ncbi:putative pyridoxamine phosphate oxidase [Aspergillus sergii]|uniref:lipoyl(octanoyl) transferase n=1 Tax=Aspergillus sergii TaxID=1034303 RepID=A0A5N6WMN3_9EURO|nr:putative pyridoxamine phosphate oxidase [Aspergillus sergii]
MTDSLNPPLSYEASATTTHPHVASTLPQEVIACLKNSRFLHLATCDGLTPHVSLMSYTYLPSTPYDQYPTIIMTTNPSSRKTNHLLTNPRVSLLVHDWVSHRPPTRAPNPGGQRDGSPPPAATRSSLANLLLNLNTSALSSISTTIAGSARVLEPGSEEEAWCKEQHLENNTFEEEMGLFGQQQQQQPGQRRPSISIDDDVRVVTVRVREGRIADWKGGVRDWQVVLGGEDQPAPLIHHTTKMRLAHLHIPDITSFTRVSNLQQTLTTRLLAHKKLIPKDTAPGTTPIQPPDPTIITFTPNPVYTTGRRDLPPSNTSPTAHLSLPPPLEPIRSLLTSANGAEYHPTLRGGQTTYHGPGQMVAYTILDLRRLGLTPRCHIRVLENSVVDVLRGYGIRGLITEDPGVWVPPVSGEGVPKKVTAVGVHLRRNISSYGIGFNVTEEPMWWFKQIVACGLEGREATSLEGQGVSGVEIGEVAERFVGAFVERVNQDFACGEGAKGEKIDGVYRITEEDVLGVD